MFGRPLASVPLILLLSLPLQGWSWQSGSQQPPTRWLPVTPDEFAIKESPAGPGEPAMVLYREVIRDDPNALESHYVRIKILSEEGRKFADITIPYLEKAVQVGDLRARTLSPDGSAVDFTGPIYDKVIMKTRRLRVNAKTLTLPDVQVGSIVEHSYKLRLKKFPDVLRDPRAYFFARAYSVPTVSWILQ
jgi:hypothetical protein